MTLSLFHRITFAANGRVFIPSVINLQVNNNPLRALVEIGLMHFFYQVQGS